MSKSSIKKQKTSAIKKLSEQEKDNKKVKKNLFSASVKKASEDVETNNEPITKDFEFGYAV